MRPVFCFIDDSDFELDVFARHVVPVEPGLDFVLGSTYDAVRRQLGDVYPALFLLDLYGQDPDVADPRIPSQADLAGQVAAFPALADVYDGLDGFPGDRINEFLKRLFNLADSWRRLFYGVSRAVGQNIRYGLDNLEAARRDYPAVAAVGYTRKSLFMDAIDVMDAGIDGLTQKPGGQDDNSIREATAAAAPGLIRAWADLVTQNYTAYLRNLVLLLVRSGLEGEVQRLKTPDHLSAAARDVLGPGDVSFLHTAAGWWAYTGLEPNL